MLTIRNENYFVEMQIGLGYNLLLPCVYWPVLCQLVNTVSIFNFLCLCVKFSIELAFNTVLSTYIVNKYLK